MHCLRGSSPGVMRPLLPRVVYYGKAWRNRPRGVELCSESVLGACEGTQRSKKVSDSPLGGNEAKIILYNNMTKIENNPYHSVTISHEMSNRIY